MPENTTPDIWYLLQNSMEGEEAHGSRAEIRLAMNDICIWITDSLCYTAATNTTL